MRCKLFWDEERRARVRRLIRTLLRAVDQLNVEFSLEKRKFTADGHMVGSIGEVLASYAFDLELLPPSSPVHDARAPDGTLVQIKLTGGRTVSLNSRPDHIVVLRLSGKKVVAIYNGPGSDVWKNCGPRQKNGQRQISLSKLRTLDARTARKIRQARPFPL